MVRGWAAHRVGGEPLAGWAAEAPRWTVVETPARVFNPSRPTKVGRGQRVKGRREREGEGGFFPLLAALSTANENLLPLPYLPASLPACLSASQLACHRYLPPLPPPVSLRIYGNLSVSTIFVVAWFRLARDSKLIDSFDSGCRTGWIHFHVWRSNTWHDVRRVGEGADKSWGGYFKPLNFNRYEIRRYFYVGTIDLKKYAKERGTNLILISMKVDASFFVIILKFVILTGLVILAMNLM